MTQGPSAHGLDPQASQIRGSAPRMTGEVDGSGEWAEPGARGEADAATHRAAWAPCCSARLTSDWIGYSGRPFRLLPPSRGSAAPMASADNGSSIVAGSGIDTSILSTTANPGVVSAVISPPKKPSISNCPSMAGSQGPNGNSEVTESSSVEPVDPSTMRVCTLAEIASKSSCTPYHLPSTAGTPRSRSATTFWVAASSCQVCVRAPASRATVGVCEGSVVPCSWLKPICIAQSRPISVPGGQPHWARSGFGSKSLKRSYEYRHWWNKSLNCRSRDRSPCSVRFLQSGLRPGRCRAFAYVL